MRLDRGTREVKSCTLPFHVFFNSDADIVRRGALNECGNMARKQTAQENVVKRKHGGGKLYKKRG